MYGDVCAIDPGVGGALVYSCNGKIYSVHMSETESGIVERIREIDQLLGGCLFVLEKPPYTAGFNRPAARIAKLFENYAFVKGFIIGMGRVVLSVNPNEWQKIYKPLPKVYAERKIAIYDAVCKQYPNEKVTKYAADAWGIYHWYKTTKGV